MHQESVTFDLVIHVRKRAETSNFFSPKNMNWGRCRGLVIA